MTDAHHGPRHRHKSPLDLFFVFGGIAAAAWLLCTPILTLRRWGMPADAFLEGGAGQLGLGIFAIGVFMSAIGPGLLLGNIAMWLIPFIRARQDRLYGAKSEHVFRHGNRSLAQFSAAALLTVYPLAVCGGMAYFALSPGGAEVRPWFSAQNRHYAWRQVRRIETNCHTGSRGSRVVRYRLGFDDGQEIDLAAESMGKFLDGYEGLRKALHDKPVDFRFDPDGSAYCPADWMPYLRERP
jgi:hypothetical protein